MKRFLGYVFGVIPSLTLGWACTTDEHSLGGDNQRQTSDGGSGAPSGDGGETLPASEIFPCPGFPTGPAPESDPVHVEQFAIDGDRISFDIRYGGGCEEHSFELCHGSLGLSEPPYVPVYVLHDANADTCNAWLSDTLTFDLTSLAETFLGDAGLLVIEAWSRDGLGDAVSAGHDLYRVGELECRDRAFAAEWDALNMEPPNSDCSTAQDCQWASRDTVCSRVCGTLVSASGAIELSDALRTISEETCGDAEADGCVVPDLGTCPPPESIDCVGGQCVAGP